MPFKISDMSSVIQGCTIAVKNTKVKNPHLPGNSATVTFLGWWVYMTLLKGLLVKWPPTIGDEVGSRRLGHHLVRLYYLTVFLFIPDTWEVGGNDDFKQPGSFNHHLVEVIIFANNRTTSKWYFPESTTGKALTPWLVNACSVPRTR